ncbi:hypothetical protein [Nocardia brasiliensis]|uniref:hypothetical protein n=1 Tax=Nocardia brasiliensis TaxID=37326 RepID=UPI002455402F|nr:hypothetical protein [Nocardia brasiliensis]
MNAGRGPIPTHGQSLHPHDAALGRPFPVVEFAQEEIDAAHQELAAALTRRWGAAKRVDLAPYLEDAEEPMGQLCGDMLV